MLNVSGHRIGSAEIESALVAHPNVAEAAVIGYPHDTKGCDPRAHRAPASRGGDVSRVRGGGRSEGICCYVTCKSHVEETPELIAALRNQIRKIIGPFASPDLIVITPALPKTRSGKIMRRVLRKIVAQKTDELGDLSTLADPTVVDVLIEKVNALLAAAKT